MSSSTSSRVGARLRLLVSLLPKNKIWEFMNGYKWPEWTFENEDIFHEFGATAAASKHVVMTNIFVFRSYRDQGKKLLK